MTQIPRRAFILTGLATLAACSRTPEVADVATDAPLYPGETPQIRALINHYADLYDVLQQASTNKYWWVEDQNNLYRACEAVEIASTTDIYVDGAHFGPEFGTELLPYNTVTEAYDVAFPGDDLKVKAGTYNERPTFRKIMTITSRDGTVRIEG